MDFRPSEAIRLQKLIEMNTDTNNTVFVMVHNRMGS